MRLFESLPWFILLVSAGILVESLDSFFLPLSTLSHAQSLSLPHRVEFSARVENIRYSSNALVFDAVHAGTLTCYLRHPPPLMLLFPDENYFIRATLVRTLQGRLCVVNSIRPFFP